MKIGFGRQFKSLPMDYLGYADIWTAVSEIAPNPTQPNGAGTLDDPYRPLGIGNWFWLSRKEIGEDAIFIKVAHRLIAKWGSSAGGLKSYTSDVTDIPRHELQQNQKAASQKVKAEGEKADTRRGYEIDKEMVYTRKAKRVEKVQATAASLARELLWSHGSADADAEELANTICGLLISEGGADRDCKTKGAIFMSTFMLLDLVEKAIQYGSRGQFYSWPAMLMHAGPGKPAPFHIEGRHDKAGDTRKLAKHPMAGLGTVNLAKTMDQNTGNKARDRVVSIAAAWLVNYLAEGHHGGDWKYYYVKTASDTGLTPKKNPMLKNPYKSYAHLLEVAKISLRTRAGTTSCLLTGSRNGTIGYVNA